MSLLHAEVGEGSPAVGGNALTVFALKPLHCRFGKAVVAVKRTVTCRV